MHHDQFPLPKDFIYIIHETRIVRFNGVAALVFLLWDILITFGDEVQYIWPQKRQSPTKWVFLFTRYFALLAQARLVSLSLTLVLGTFDLEVCRMVYASQVVSGGVLMACIQSILMLRVYALYIQDRRIAYTMIALLVAELGSMPGVIAMTLPTDTGAMCMKPVKMRDIALFGVSAILPQLLVLGLTILKFFSGLRAGWGNIPIVSRLVRDDIILVAIIVTWSAISAVMTKVDTVYGYIGYSWLLSLIPSAGCRMIISMQKLAEDHSTQHNGRQAESGSTPQLTTCIFDSMSPATTPDILTILRDGSTSSKQAHTPSRAQTPSILSRRSLSTSSHTGSMGIKTVMRDPGDSTSLRPPDSFPTSRISYNQ